MYSKIVFQPTRMNIIQNGTKFAKRLDNEEVPYFEFNQESQYFLIVSHGTSDNIYFSKDFCSELSDFFKINIIAYDYAGYSVHTKKSPSEEDCYKDIETISNMLTEDRKIPYDNIFLMGSSLGTGVTCYLASKVCKLGKMFAGVILLAPFLSIVSIFSNVLSNVPYLDMFESYKRIPNIKSPLLIIHGDQDSLIPYSHGKKLADMAPNLWKFILLKGEKHNINLFNKDKHVKNIAEFINFVENQNKELDGNLNVCNNPDDENLQNNLDDENLHFLISLILTAYKFVISSKEKQLNLKNSLDVYNQWLISNFSLSLISTSLIFSLLSFIFLLYRQLIYGQTLTIYLVFTCLSSSGLSYYFYKNEYYKKILNEKIEEITP